MKKNGGASRDLA